jgi:hypothetical protein
MCETDLDRLCVDLPPDELEIFPPNAWYGAAHVIREYCGWPRDRPLPVVVPHGMQYLATRVWTPERRNWLPAIYSFPPYRDVAYRTGTRKRVIPGCSPWLYLPPEKGGTGEGRGEVLLMPTHSTHHIVADMDHARFADVARQKFPGRSIVCCLYWRDVQLGHAHVYQRKGLGVVSAGHMFDPLFLHRLKTILGRAALVLTNDLGTHAFYAASIGVPVIVDSVVEARWDAAPQALARDFLPGTNAAMYDYCNLLYRRPDPDISLQRRAAEEMLGKERMHSPEELHALLEGLWNEPGFAARVLAARVWEGVSPIRSLVRRSLRLA